MKSNTIKNSINAYGWKLLIATCMLFVILMITEMVVVHAEETEEDWYYPRNFDQVVLGSKNPQDYADITYAINFDQVSAREMYTYLNAFRTGHDVDGEQPRCFSHPTEIAEGAGEYIYYNDLQPLIYDYELEKIAMYRAAECAIRYYHSRPNGDYVVAIKYPKTDGTLDAPSTSNIAWTNGIEGALGAFRVLREDKGPYNQQGHRNQMLNHNFTHVGIGHAYIGNQHYWVQVFGNDSNLKYNFQNDPDHWERWGTEIENYTNIFNNLNSGSGKPKTEAFVGEKNMRIQLCTTSECFTKFEFHVGVTHVESGKTTNVPNNVLVDITEADHYGCLTKDGSDHDIPVSNTFFDNLDLKYRPRAAHILNWTSSDPSIAVVENGKLHGVSDGITTITAKFGAQTVTAKVIVGEPVTISAPEKLEVVHGKSANLNARTVCASGTQYPIAYKLIGAWENSYDENGNLKRHFELIDENGIVTSQTDDNTNYGYTVRTYLVEDPDIYADTRIDVIHDLEYVPEVPATCTSHGHIAYYHATCCDKYYDSPEAARRDKYNNNFNGKTLWGQIEPFLLLPSKGHDPGEAVRENETAPNCEVYGSWDIVTRCKTCGEILEKETEYTPKLGHITGEEIREEISPATCTTNGSYRLVRYCTRCDQIMTASIHTIRATGHTAGTPEAVYKAPTCTEDGINIYVVKCSKCGEYLENIHETLPASGHKAGSPVTEDLTAATCTQSGGYDMVTYCSVCHEQLHSEHTEIPATGHKAGTARQENLTYPTCTEPGGYDMVRYCSVCGDKVGSTHTVTPAYGHAPDNPVIEDHVEATCTEPGGYDMVTYCSVCHEQLHSEHTEIPATGHTASAPVQENRVEAECTSEGGYDETTYCSVCHAKLGSSHKAIPATGHDWNTWVTTKEPTENAEGERQRTCRHDPSHKETETLPKKSHVHSTQKVSAVAATCTNTGIKEHWECTGCHKLFADSKATQEVTVEDLVIPKTAHAGGAEQKENVIPSTCTAGGSYEAVIYCTVCKVGISRTLQTTKPLGHDWDAWVTTKEPTENAEGERQRTCRHDSSHKETETLPKKSHVHSIKKVEAVPATCIREGVREYWECEECHRIFADRNAAQELTANDLATPKVSHTAGTEQQENIVPATCTAPGSYDRVTYCTVCKAELSRTQETTKALGHDWNEWTITKSPTETEPGERIRICRHDRSHVEKEPIAETVHEHSLQKVNAVSATCIKDGTVAYWECSKCHEMFADQNGTQILTAKELRIPATGHDWGEWAVTKEATPEQNGEEQRICRHDPSHTETRETAYEGSRNIREADIRVLSIPQYTGSPLKPEIVVTYGGETLSVGTGYVVSYSNNTNAGTGRITITGVGRYAGQISTTFTILPKKAKAKLKLSDTEFAYSGSTKKPKLTVTADGKTLSSKDYTVTWPSGMKKVGTYTVKVTLKGNYKGSASAKYEIRPKPLSKAPSVIVGKKSLMVKWKKQTKETSGYEIQCATNSRFTSGKKTVTVTKSSVSSKTISELKAKKTYYVRIRTYKTVNGKKYYSEWSKVKIGKTR